MMGRDNPRLVARRLVVALSAAVTLSAAVAAITNAADDAPVAEDITHAEPVHRLTPYGARPSVVDLALDHDGGALRYEIVDQPAVDGRTVGSAVVSGARARLSINRDAPAGPARFTYVAVDGAGVRSDEAAVSFEIANRTPLTRDLTLTTGRDTPLDIWPYARDVEDGGPFAWRSDGNRITYSNPMHGTIEPFFGPDGSQPEFADIEHKVVYVPDPGYVGADSFTYTFTDEDGADASGTVSVDVIEPAEPTWGEVSGARYRCAVQVGADDVASALVSRYLGGDLVLMIDAGVEAPRRISSGESYELRSPWLQVRAQQGFSDLLAGASVGGDVRLQDAGFGQSSVAADATLSLDIIRRRGGARSREIAVNGMSAGPVPIRTNDLTLRLAGDTVRLEAPSTGAVEVALPRILLVDLTLEPGLDGPGDTLGLRCFAAQEARLRIVRIPITPARLVVFTRLPGARRS